MGETGEDVDTPTRETGTVLLLLLEAGTIGPGLAGVDVPLGRGEEESVAVTLVRCREVGLGRFGFGGSFLILFPAAVVGEGVVAPGDFRSGGGTTASGGLPLEALRLTTLRVCRGEAEGGSFGRPRTTGRVDTDMSVVN